MNDCFAVDYKFERIDVDAPDLAIRNISGKDKAIIYGAGNNGGLIYEYLKRKGTEASCFCDKDETKQTGLYFGKEVISPENLFERYSGEIVIISLYDVQSAIWEFLMKNGVANIVRLPFIEPCGKLLIPQDLSPRGFAERFRLSRKTITVNYCKTAKKDPPVLFNTTVYNIQESYLRRAIESVLNQTNSNFRYLIVDNGSTDGSSETIGEYAKLDKRIEVIHRDKNIAGLEWTKAGTEAYLQTFYSKLTTEYFCKLDADDYLHPCFLERTFDLALEYKADIVACQSLHYHETNPYDQWSTHGHSLAKGFYGAEDIITALLDHLHLWRPVWGKLMRTTVYLSQKGIIAENAGNISDVYKMFNRVLASGSIYVADELLHYYTIRDNSTAQKLSRDSAAGTRIYCLYNWLYEKLVEYNAATAFNIHVINNFAFAHIEIPDFEILDKAAETEPQLAVAAIRKIMTAEIPSGLANDHRIHGVYTRLQSLLEKAGGNADERVIS
jgi:glycosyltransferase involved in cell wall biosynthesis